MTTNEMVLLGMFGLESRAQKMAERSRLHGFGTIVKFLDGTWYAYRTPLKGFEFSRLVVDGGAK